MDGRGGERRGKRTRTMKRLARGGDWDVWREDPNDGRKEDYEAQSPEFSSP